MRALASLLPPIETIAGCPFQRAPGEAISDWPLPPDSPIVKRCVSLVELPLGATEDRVLGSLHLEKALRGERVGAQSFRKVVPESRDRGAEEGKDEDP